MEKVEFNKAQVIKYLIVTFGVAYAIQIVVWLLYSNGYTMVGQCVMAVMMFIPMLGTVLSGYKLKGMGWKPNIKQNWKTILIAWFSPMILTAIGAGLYFALFPSHFDLSGSYMMEIAGEDILKQMEEQGLSYPMLVLLSCVSCITYAPLMNMLVAVGEESGWRGFLFLAEIVVKLSLAQAAVFRLLTTARTIDSCAITVDFRCQFLKVVLSVMIMK